MSQLTENLSAKIIKTDLKVLHSNIAVYISAILYDDEPYKIYRELTLIITILFLRSAIGKQRIIILQENTPLQTK